MGKRKWGKKQNTVSTFPHRIRLHKVNTYARIFGDRVVGSFFFNNNVTGTKYLQILRDELISKLAVLYSNSDNIDFSNQRI